MGPILNASFSNQDVLNATGDYGPLLFQRQAIACRPQPPVLFGATGQSLSLCWCRVLLENGILDAFSALPIGQ